jgi:hypothetical protein
VCDHPPEGRGELGDVCGATPLDPEGCANGFCDGALDGQCTAPCASDDDCGQGKICTASPVLGDGSRFCVTPCSRMSDCGATRDGSGARICAVACDESSSEFEGFCTAASNSDGVVPVGGTSTANEDCISGNSLNDSLIDQTYCTAPCVQTSDCPTIIDAVGTTHQMTCTARLARSCPANGFSDRNLYCRRPAAFVASATERIALHARLSSEVCTSFTLASTRSFRLVTGTADSATNCPGDTVMTLRSSAGAQIAADDDGGAGTCSLIQRTSQPAGTYQACVRPFSSVVSNVGVWLTLE